MQKDKKAYYDNIDCEQGLRNAEKKLLKKSSGWQQRMTQNTTKPISKRPSTMWGPSTHSNLNEELEAPIIYRRSFGRQPADDEPMSVDYLIWEKIPISKPAETPSKQSNTAERKNGQRTEDLHQRR